MWRDWQMSDNGHLTTRPRHPTTRRHVVYHNNNNNRYRRRRAEDQLEIGNGAWGLPFPARQRYDASRSYRYRLKWGGDGGRGKEGEEETVWDLP